MARVTGTVKWFSNRKGFGFLAPTSDNSPTEDEIFVHHSSLQMVEGAYRTVAEGAEVEFEVETDSNGKLKAVNVTNVGGAALVPPPREKRRPRNKARAENQSGADENAAAPAQEDGDKESNVNKDNGNVGKKDNHNGNQDRANKEPVKREPPFHNVITDDLKEKITEKGFKLVRNTIDVSLGGSRIKLGQGGYSSLVDAKGLVGEGSYTCDETAKVTFTWERCLQFEDEKWQSGNASDLVASISLVEDDVSPVKPDETPEALWGPDKPNPNDLFAEHGFKMKKVILSRPQGGRGRGRHNGPKSE